MRTQEQLDAMRAKGQRALQKKLREKYTGMGFKTREAYDDWNKTRRNARNRVAHVLGGTYAEGAALYDRIEAAHPKKRLDVEAIVKLARHEVEQSTTSPSTNGTHATTRRHTRTAHANGTHPVSHEEPVLRDEGEDIETQRAESFACGYLVSWIEGYARQHGLPVGAFTERVGRLLQRAGRR